MIKSPYNKGKGFKELTMEELFRHTAHLFIMSEMMLEEKKPTEKMIKAYFAGMGAAAMGYKNEVNMEKMGDISCELMEEYEQTGKIEDNK